MKVFGERAHGVGAAAGNSLDGSNHAMLARYESTPNVQATAAPGPLDQTFSEDETERSDSPSDGLNERNEPTQRSMQSHTNWQRQPSGQRHSGPDGDAASGSLSDRSHGKWSASCQSPFLPLPAADTLQASGLGRPWQKKR